MNISLDEIFPLPVMAEGVWSELICPASSKLRAVKLFVSSGPGPTLPLTVSPAAADLSILRSNGISAFKSSAPSSASDLASTSPVTWLVVAGASDAGATEARRAMFL